jgi:hypothetical protein
MKQRCHGAAFFRASTPEQFANIIVKSDNRGRVTRVRDIGRVEIGAADYGAARPTWIAAMRRPCSSMPSPAPTHGWAARPLELVRKRGQFGAELDAMRGLLEDMIRQSGGH